MKALPPTTGGLTPRPTPVVPVPGAPREGWPDDSLDPRRLLSLLWRNWRTVLGIMLLVIVPVMVATLLAPPMYRSTALVEVNLEGASLLPYQDFGSRATGNNYLLYMTTQEELLRGPSLVARVAEALRGEATVELRDEARHLVDRRTIEQVPNSQLFSISYLAPRPDTAAHVANLMADEYVRSRFEGRQATRTRAREVLQEELATLELRVQRSERELLDYAQAHDIQATDPGEDDLAEEKLSQLATQLIDAEAEVVMARARVETLERLPPAEFSQQSATSLVEGRTATLLALEHELTSLRSTFGENWPAVVRKRNEMALVREQLERERASALGQAIDEAEIELRAAEGRRDMLAAAAGAQEALVDDLQGSSIQYNILRREVETHKNLYEGLLARLNETGIRADIDLGAIRVVEPARPNPTVASPDILWNLSLAALLGISLGVCCVLGGDFWRNTVTTLEDVEQVTALPVLAPIPFVEPTYTLAGAAADEEAGGRRKARATTLSLRSRPAGRRRQQATVRRPGVHASAEGAEAVRSLCASILLSRSDASPRTIAVTSAAPGEGKTTIAIGLARMLAQTGASTLLVECDMRRPTFDQEFGIDAAGGLSVFLAGHVDRPTVHQTDEAELSVIGAGPTPPNPVALLTSARLAAFLRESAGRYDFVVLDTPPALAMADARMVSALAEGVLLVARSGQTPKRLLRRVQTVLEASGSPLLGVVLNSVDDHHLGSSYYGYAAYYGSSSPAA